MPKYIAITKERIHLAEIGKLKIRPMERSVYDPESPSKNLPPQSVQLNSYSEQLSFLRKDQLDLFEKSAAEGLK